MKYIKYLLVFLIGVIAGNLPETYSNLKWVYYNEEASVISETFKNGEERRNFIYSHFNEIDYSIKLFGNYLQLDLCIYNREHFYNNAYCKNIQKAWVIIQPKSKSNFEDLEYWK